MSWPRGRGSWHASTARPATASFAVVSGAFKACGTRMATEQWLACPCTVAMPIPLGQSSGPILFSKEGMRMSNGLRRERTEGCACCAVESLASRLTGHSVAVKLQPRRDRRDRRDTARQPPTHALPSSCTLLTLASVATVQMGFAKAVSPVPSPLRAPSYPPTLLPAYPSTLPTSPPLCVLRDGGGERHGGRGALDPRSRA